METIFYKIETLTNLHAGSGDANYGVVDNLIQRDVVTGLPTIHGSSFKGALKEHFSWDEKDDKAKHIFGTGDNSGNYKFLSALLLAIPLRSNKKPYYMATSPAAIKELLNMAEQLNFTFKKVVKNEFKKLASEKVEVAKPKVIEPIGLIVEDYNDCKKLDYNLDKETENILNITDSNLLLLNDNDLIKITNNSNLPVIARNKLGDDKNLWYEQVVPRKSIFWTALILPKGKKYFTEFENDLKIPVHIGANASVGYGFTNITAIKSAKEEENKNENAVVE